MRGNRPARWVRLASLGLVAVIVFWLPFEDTSSRFPLILSGTAAILGFFAGPDFRPGSEPCLVPAYRIILIGALAGLIVAPGAAALMVFKSGLHGHGFPDFTVNQLIEVFRLAPILGLAGAAAGAGAGAWQRRKCPDD